jgi:alkylation response protein AidB-like acyl-CoA dehydrogenase
VTTRAERDGAGWRLRGEKIQVLDAPSADALVVVARSAGSDDARDGLSLFLVEGGAPGLSVERQTRIDHRSCGIVRLDGVAVGAEALIGRPGEGLPVLEQALERATAGLCAEMLGSMSQAFELTLQHLKSRIQFGVPIGSFQALKHRAARCFIEIELSRSTVMAATRALDAGDADASKLVSLAKARCSDAFVLVANEAVQMFGGVGMTDEYDIGFYLKRARVAELTLGDSAWHRERWARLEGY